MTIRDLALYALALAGLWAVPGPVWVALVARALSGGMRGAWPLAVGVAVGDLLWPLLALLGLSWLLAQYGGLLELLRWAAAVVFVIMGLLLLRKPASTGGPDSRLTRPGIWAGFSVGLAAVIGNPKAILFYMGFLPGFFDPAALRPADIAAILAVSALVPMLGNLGLAFCLSQARALLASPVALRRMNIGAGLLLVLVGLVIPFT